MSIETRVFCFGLFDLSVRVYRSGEPRTRVNNAQDEFSLQGEDIRLLQCRRR